MARARVVQAFSAGGVVFRRAPGATGASPAVEATIPGHTATANPLDDVEIALVGRTYSDIWVIPKGTPHRDESVADAALREVREETGLITRIVAELGSVHYTFSRDGTRFHKEVFHYLLEAIGGDVSLHDAEYDEARWFPLGVALRRLTFDNEADMLRRAQPLIARAIAGEPVGEQQVSHGGASAGDGRGAE
jgi:8-oxo-dGTP pyrophosphatase MutT (NUDIX family)